MFNILKKKPKTTAEEKIEKIIEILFPPLHTHIDKEGNKFHVDYSADINLDAALTDLEEGYNDDASRKTIKNISNRLFEIRKLVEVYRSLDTDAKYVLVDDLDDTRLENISAVDDVSLDRHTKP